MMVATFRLEQLEEACKIMNSYHTTLKYSRIDINDKKICIVEQGPLAALIRIRYELSNPEDLKILNLI